LSTARPAASIAARTRWIPFLEIDGSGARGPHVRVSKNNSIGYLALMTRFRSAARARRTVCHAFCLIIIVATLVPAAARAAPIDFNQLFHDPGAPISIAADGSSAVLSEDPSVFAVFLSNVPAFGDPQLITAAPGARLAFEYSFNEPAGNADLFHFALLEGTTGNPLAGNELFVTETSSGGVSLDLSAFIGASLGLQFELIPDLSNDLGFDSMLTLSNLRIELPDITPLEEPGSGVLFFLAFTSVLVWKFRRANATA
jgi:hypothetical protein